jgi:hypothetical protein
MEENKEILLPSKRYKKAEEQDLTLQVSLESSESLMRLGDRDIVLDLEKLFNKERQDSIDYKIYGKMKMVFRNMYSGDTPYDYLSENLYLAGDGVTGVGNAATFTGFLPYDEFAFLRRDLRRQVNTPASGTNITPLMLSAWNGHVHCVECLVAHDANVNAKDYRDWTALHGAAAAGFDVIVVRQFGHILERAYDCVIQFLQNV